MASRPTEKIHLYFLLGCLAALSVDGKLISSIQKYLSVSILAKSKYFHNTAFIVQREH